VLSHGIRVTDEFNRLSSEDVSRDLPAEIESRWRLVETAWRLQLSRSMVITYDSTDEMLLLPDRSLRRAPVTGSRSALNGYQRGICFYCGCDISLTDLSKRPDVDHFFPHVLKTRTGSTAVDGVWNLVLSCRECNRGAKGKSDRIPSLRLLEKLYARNEYLITSHHPLRKTLVAQTGSDAVQRRMFLRDMHQRSLPVLLHTWDPPQR